MSSGEVSDASPPRRRPARENADYSSSRNPTSFSDGLRSHPNADHPFAPPNAFRSERRREDAGTRLRPRTSFDAYQTGKENENTRGDVSDASPPRRRRRMDEHSRRASHFERSHLDGDDNQSWRPSRRGNQPESTFSLADNPSIRSTAISSRNYNPDSRGRTSLSETRTRPSSTAHRAPPNRFGIRPGSRWDGVNRSNGFEDRLEAMRSMKQDVEVEGYRASVADL